MIARGARQRNVGLGGGVVSSWLGVGLIYVYPHGLLAPIGVMLVAIGLLLWFWGFMAYAWAKGYHAGLGILLALFLNIFGLLVLAALPDKTKPTDSERGKSEPLPGPRT